MRRECRAVIVAPLPTDAAMEQRAVTEDDWDDKEKLAAFRAAVQAGADDIEAGRFISFSSTDELRRFVKAKFDAALARRSP